MSELIVVSSDHAGWALKSHVKPFLEGLGFSVEDVGTYDAEPVDYPSFTLKAALKVVSGTCKRAIVFCGTGQGDAIVANKVPGIRAALCWDATTARLSRAHNDANVLVLGGWFIGHRFAEEIIKVWLETPFDGGRHARRLGEVASIEKEMLTRRGCIYDLSGTIFSGMPVWPGDVEVSLVKGTSQGIAKSTTIAMSLHTGTHVDSPAHLFPGGRGVECLDLGVLIGNARVIQLGDIKTINCTALAEHNLDGVTRLIIGTQKGPDNGGTVVYGACPGLSVEAAQYLIKRGVSLLAMEGLSVDGNRTDLFPVHKVLLGSGVVVVEGVNLSGVAPGDYELICLPLKIAGGDGAPARVILRAF